VKTYGLTGGIGMGKSTTARFLEQRGIPVSDSDEIARRIVEPGEPALAEIQSRFGDHLIDPRGQLRREKLAEIVFADPSARQALESILHPRIQAIWRAQLEDWRREGRPVAVAMIPLLFETNGEGAFDATICVACLGSTQRERLRGRGWADEAIERRIAAQMPIENKMALADYVVWTEGDLEVHRAQLERITG